MARRKPSPPLFDSDPIYLQSKYRWFDLRANRLATARKLRERAEGGRKRSRGFCGRVGQGGCPHRPPHRSRHAELPHSAPLLTDSLTRAPPVFGHAGTGRAPRFA